MIDPSVAALRSSSSQILISRKSCNSQEVDVDVVFYRPTPIAQPLPILTQPFVFWIASGQGTLEIHTDDGDRKAVAIQSGEFVLLAGSPSSQAHLHSSSAIPLTAMHVSIGLPLLGRAAREWTNGIPVSFRLREAHGEQDDVLSMLLNLLYTSLRGSSDVCHSFVKGISQALASHIARQYKGEQHVFASSPGGLPAYKLHRVFDAMRNKLAEPFELEQLADAVGLSPCHFSRAFKRTTGVSPSRYFVNLRMEEAKLMLINRKYSIIDVSLSLGYRSPSHFAQVFRQLTGVSPSAYRDSIWTTTGPVDKCFLPLKRAQRSLV